MNKQMTQEKATVKMTTKSWHYKLTKLVLGQAAPTPQNMHNLCPYFWLMFASLIFCPIVLPIRGVIWLVNKIRNGVVNFTMNVMVIPAATSWEDGLSDLDVYQIFQADKSIKKSYKKAFGENEAFNYQSRNQFTFNWFKKKYNKESLTKGSTDYSYSFTKSFQKWLDTCHEDMKEVYKLQSEKDREKQKKEMVYEEKMSDFRDGIDRFFDRIKTAVSSWKNIIKWTKRIVGLMVTLIGLLATYVIVSFLGKIILWLVENWRWDVVIGVGIFAAFIGVVILLVYLMRAWVNYMKDKGTNLWYVKLAFGLATLIYWPIKIVFYHFVYQLLLVNLWYLIVKGAKGLWRGFLNFLGIFGEYFGASYTDYCPGIEWEEENE